MFEKQLEQLPEGWGVDSLCNVADVIDPHPSHRAPPEVKDGIPFPGIGDFGKDGYIDYRSCRRVDHRVFNEHQKRYSIEDGDLGFGRVATIGKVIRLRTDLLPYAVSPTLAVIKPKCIDKEYLSSFLDSLLVTDQIRSLLTGTTRSSLGIQLLRKLQILKPPGGEQEQIGVILSTIEKAIKQTEAIIAKQTRIKNGLMQDLLTRGIDEHGNIRSEATHEFKNSPIGRIPVEWDVFSAEEFCTSVADGTHDSPKPAPHGKPLVTSKQLKNGRIAWDDYYFVSLKDYEIIRRRSWVEEGDILYGMIGTIGSPVMVRSDETEIAVKNVGIFRFGGNLDRAYWALQILGSRVIEGQVDLVLAGSTQRFVGLGVIRAFLIPAPVKDNEIRRINTVLAGVEAAIESQTRELDKLISIRRALMQDLLTGKVRVTELLGKNQEQLAGIA